MILEYSKLTEHFLERCGFQNHESFWKAGTKQDPVLSKCEYKNEHGKKVTFYPFQSFDG